MHNFGSKSVKYLGEEGIKIFKHTAPVTARGGKQLLRTESKKTIQMRSAVLINGKRFKSMVKRSVEQMKGKDIGSLINMISKSKPQLPLVFVTGGLNKLTEFRLVSPDDDLDMKLKNEEPKDIEKVEQNEEKIKMERRNILTARSKEYYMKNKDKIAEQRKAIYSKNKHKILIDRKEYRLNNTDLIAKYRRTYYQNKKDSILMKTKEHKLKNKEKILEYNKDYYIKNKEKIAEKKIEYNNKNKDKIIKRSKEYYQKNKAKIYEREKKYREDNKEKIKGYARKYYNNNKVKLAEKRKEYRANNKDKIEETAKRYRDNNKELMKKINKKAYETAKLTLKGQLYRLLRSEKLSKDREKRKKSYSENPITTDYQVNETSN